MLRYSGESGLPNSISIGSCPYCQNFRFFFVNTLTANYEYSRKKTGNLQPPVRMQLSRKLKLFSGFFIAFSETVLNFEHFEKTISLTAQAFLKLLTSRDVFTYMHKRSCFCKPFGSERVKERQGHLSVFHHHLRGLYAFMTSVLFSDCKFLNSNKRKVNSWTKGLDYFILRLGDENEIWNEDLRCHFLVKLKEATKRCNLLFKDNRQGILTDRAY